ncbi:Vacuolar protein sorting-associate Vta1 N-terminal [Penicillium verhagenii]|nr:Vacuolar protein sorting-associate Vta1 N-terminal [Penicillium verhagenii]
MASSIPAGVRSSDIGRFALRATQIEKAKPVIAYWCNYHIVNQIIARGLHNSDDEVKLYTADLMDKLEQFKTENLENEIVTDNVAANAYVEQFGVEVFNRAQAAMTANKVTRQTGDTFLAAATFLELCQTWGDSDPDIIGRIKFAKYHAIRITKAIKAGEDPNASNPVPKEEEEEEVQVESLDVQAFDESVAEQAARPRQASVEEIPDEADRLGRQMAHQSSLNESLHPSRTSSLPPTATPTPDIPSVPQNAPGSPPQRTELGDHSGDLELPSTPGTIGNSTSIPQLPDTPGSINANKASSFNAFQSFPPPSASVAAPDSASFYDPPSPVAHNPAPSGPPLFNHPAAPSPAASSQPSHSVDDNSITLAQKHARWAVSALTFDDVETAIKELKASLKFLGVE